MPAVSENLPDDDDACNLFNTIIIIKQVRTNIGLADTLIPSSFIYLIYMGGTGQCDSIKIIFVYHVNS